MQIFASAKTTILVLHNVLECWNYNVCRLQKLTKNDGVGHSTRFCVIIRRVVCTYKHLTVSSTMQGNTVKVVCVCVCVCVSACVWSCGDLVQLLIQHCVSNGTATVDVRYSTHARAHTHTHTHARAHAHRCVCERKHKALKNFKDAILVLTE